MDGALVRAKPMAGLDLVAYGGYQDADLQPYPEKPDRSFGTYGAQLKTSNLLGSLVTLGYHGLAPTNDSPRHFVDVGFRRAVPYTDRADVYSRLELDARKGDAAFVNAGVGVSVARPLYVNLEYDSYEPDPSTTASCRTGSSTRSRSTACTRRASGSPGTRRAGSTCRRATRSRPTTSTTTTRRTATS